MGKLILILLLGTIVVFAVLNLNINVGLNTATDNSLGNYAAASASNIANTTTQMLIAKLGDDKTYRNTVPIHISLLGGTADYTVITNIVGTDTLAKISVKGTYMGVDRNLSARVKFPPAGGPVFPGGVMAAITTNNPVTTLGNLTVDGRDHDINGNLLVGKGTKGIWTTQTYSRGGASTIGGTYQKVDYAPAKNYNSNIVGVNQTWPGGYPSTPEGVLGGVPSGFPPGKLKTIAQSGAGGGQYVTDPSKLKYPLKGVTYVELPNNGCWQSMSIDGSGILIVHNQWLNAQMKNLNSGTFKGLIIADDIVHIHTNVIGAIVGISPSPSEGNCIGNGNGSVLYSAQAILGGIPIVGGANLGYGYGKHRVAVMDWYE